MDLETLNSLRALCVCCAVVAVYANFYLSVFGRISSAPSAEMSECSTRRARASTSERETISFVCSMRHTHTHARADSLACKCVVFGLQNLVFNMHQHIAICASIPLQSALSLAQENGKHVYLHPQLLLFSLFICSPMYRLLTEWAIKPFPSARSECNKINRIVHTCRIGAKSFVFSNMQTESRRGPNRGRIFR